MFCVKCGAELPDGAMFCTQCGNRVTVVQIAGRQNAFIIKSPVHTGNSTKQRPESPPSRLPVIAAVMAVLAVLVGIGSFVLINRGVSAGSSQNAASGKQSSSQSSGQKTPTGGDSGAASEKPPEFQIVESWKFEEGSSYASEVLKYTYDDKRRLVSVTKNSSPYQEYIYDDYGNLTAEYTYKNGVVSEGKEYEYDPTNTYVIAYNSIGDITNSRVEYEFDDAGNIYREHIWDPGGDPYGYIEHLYDEQNRELWYRRYREDGTPGDYGEYFYEPDGSYSKIEHNCVNVYEETVAYTYDAEGRELRRETTYEDSIRSEVEETTRSEDGKVLSIVETKFYEGRMNSQTTRINEFNEQGLFCHATVTEKILDTELDEYVETTYNRYQEYDAFGNIIHFWNDKTGDETFKVYENVFGLRTGDNFDHGDVSE